MDVLENWKTRSKLSNIHIQYVDYIFKENESRLKENGCEIMAVRG